MTVAILSLLMLTAVAIAGAGAGIALGSVAKRRLETIVQVATGALLGITVFDILPEAKESLSWVSFVVFAAAGYAFLWAVGRFVYHVCPACAIAHIDQDSALRDKRRLWMLAIALGIHCALDGVAVVAGGAGAIPTRAEVGLLLGLGLHKLPEGLALGLLLSAGGFARWGALGRAAAIESLTSIGGLVSILFMQGAPVSVIGTVFAIVGGGFLYLVANALAGAVGHRMSLTRPRTLLTQGMSCAGTGAFLWFIDRCFD